LKIQAEYIWIDGQRPTAKLRSKTKIIEAADRFVNLVDVPLWGFDGSSTMQASTKNSDCKLKPVCVVPDPIRGRPNILVLCETFNFNGKAHETNTRAMLRKAMDKYSPIDPWVGIEQEYTMYDGNGSYPLRWPSGGGYPEPQGKYYCGVGYDEICGSELKEAHLRACLDAGLSIEGTNAEVMFSQWEFQIGCGNPLIISDHLWIARYLIYTIGAQFKIAVKLDPKPIGGDWNGAGAHTNFSTREMRVENGFSVIEKACKRLGEFQKEHLAVYGANNDQRLTGEHETCNMHEFRYGIGNRGASVRIPANVAEAGFGYLEDRRPAANIDPYQVCTAMLETICGKGFDPKIFKYFYEK
jgi:glutamine synthetase